MLRFDDLGFWYRRDDWVLRHISGEVASGRVLAILGPNGRGKSTLLRLLLGTLKPVEGRVDRTGRVAFVPQLFEAAFDYTALDMVLMGRAAHVALFAQPGRQDESAALAALDRLGIADLAPRPSGELSGGQRQLVILARALVTEARILLLDEPTSALDVANQGLVLYWVRRLAREDGMTIAFTTHNPHHALAAADDVLLLQGSSGAVHGAADQMLSDEALTDLYGHPMTRLKGNDPAAADVIAPKLPKRSS